MNKLKTIKSVYNLQSFNDAASIARQFKDAEGGIILARNLEHVSSEIFTQEYVDLTFLQQGITVNNEGGYATSILKLKITPQGGFRESGDNTSTMGKITLGGEDDSIPVYMKEAESDWSETELKRAELQGINLPSRYFEAHSELYNRELDDIGLIGQVRTDGTQKTTGLLNAAWTSSAAANTADALTGQELYDEIADLINRQRAGVLNSAPYSADKVMFPSRVYNVASTKILNSAGSEKSVLSALRTNFPDVTFGMSPKADSTANGGKLANSTTIAFSSNRRAMQFRLPIPLNISNVYNKGFKYYVESMFGIAGLDIIEDDVAEVLTGL